MGGDDAAADAGLEIGGDAEVGGASPTTGLWLAVGSADRSAFGIV
jgi:hypothetical protein